MDVRENMNDKNGDEDRERDHATEPIFVKRTLVESFPLEILPKWYADYVECLSKEFNTMVDLPVSAVLSALSASLTGKILFEHNNWILNVNLYQVLAALPASKKDAVIERVFKVLYEIRKENYEQHKLKTNEYQSKIDSLNQTYESIKIKIAKTTDQNKTKEYEVKLEEINKELEKIKIAQVMRWSIISGDITPEKLVEVLDNNNGMVTIATAEASELFEHVKGRYNNSKSIDLLLKAWEGSEYTAFRTTKDDKVIPEPLLNLCLFTQPEVFDALRKFEHRGLPQRFLMLYPDRYPIEQIEAFFTFNEEIEKTFRTKVSDLYKLELTKPLKVKVDADAIYYFEKLYKEVVQNSYDEELPEVVQEWEGKIFGNLIKVVTLLLIAREVEQDGKFNEVGNLKLTVTDIKNMRKLYKYYASHFKKSYEMIKSGVKKDNLYYFFKRILELFEKHSYNRTLSSTVLNNHIPKFNSSERLNLLKELEDHNLLEVTYKGRSMKIELNSKIDCMLKEKIPPIEVLKKYFGSNS